MMTGWSLDERRAAGVEIGLWVGKWAKRFCTGERTGAGAAATGAACEAEGTTVLEEVATGVGRLGGTSPRPATAAALFSLFKSFADFPSLPLGFGVALGTAGEGGPEPEGGAEPDAEG